MKYEKSYVFLYIREKNSPVQNHHLIVHFTLWNWIVYKTALIIRKL